MDDTSERKQRLDALHSEELHRIRKSQEQQRDRIAQTQAQAREHHKLMLDLEHQAVQDATIARQKALHEQDYQHRQRILKLECQYASNKMGTGRTKSVLETENAGLRDETVVEPGQGFVESATVGSGNEGTAGPKQGFAEVASTRSRNGNSKDKASNKGGKVEYFINMAIKAAERSAEKMRG